LPDLPPTMSGHGLYEPMRDCITRIFALAEVPKFKPARVNDPLAVLHQLHRTCSNPSAGACATRVHKLDDRKIKNISAGMQESVERVTVTHDKWEYDSKGEIQSDNPDNVVVLLGVLSLQIRWNAWLEQMEIQGGSDPEFRWPVWTYIDDAVIAKLLTRARRTKTRFRPGKDFLWETLLTLSHQNEIDPILTTCRRSNRNGTARPALTHGSPAIAGRPTTTCITGSAESLLAAWSCAPGCPAANSISCPCFTVDRAPAKARSPRSWPTWGKTPLAISAPGSGKTSPTTCCLAMRPRNWFCRWRACWSLRSAKWARAATPTPHTSRR
jgi:hypothetical protein